MQNVWPFSFAGIDVVCVNESNRKILNLHSIFLEKVFIQKYLQERLNITIAFRPGNKEDINKFSNVMHNTITFILDLSCENSLPILVEVNANYTGYFTKSIS